MTEFQQKVNVLMGSDRVDIVMMQDRYLKADSNKQI